MSVIFRFFGQCFRGSSGGENTALLQAEEEDAEMVDLFAKWQTALWALAITLAYIIAGVTIYCLAESQWNFLDSLYFSHLTFMTHTHTLKHTYTHTLSLLSLIAYVLVPS